MSAAAGGSASAHHGRQAFHYLVEHLGLSVEILGGGGGLLSVGRRALRHTPMATPPSARPNATTPQILAARVILGLMERVSAAVRRYFRSG